MNGLNSHEVEYRINNNMVNNENIRNSRDIKTILLTNLITLFNFIHLALFILILTTGSINNATFIISILFNILISIYQEIKAKKIIDSLSIANVTKVRVTRDNKEIEILPSEIVIDDLLYLKQGDNLIVDAEIIESEYCEVDESIITGESNSIEKKKGDKLISGSIILSGKAYAKVTSINHNTYTNNLIKEATKNTDNSSYLQKNINAILKVVTILIIPIGILLFITQFNNNQTYSESVLSAVAGIIGMIPEGLVLLTSISLTVGVIKMASKKVIIQKLNGIELLACVDILCLDKTGTITDGTMEVIDVIKKDSTTNINQIISNMMIDKTNATDIALEKYFGKNNDLKIINHIAFASSRKYSLVEFVNGTYTLGALEFITNKQLEDYPELEKYINNGYRIITLAKCQNKKSNKETNKIIAFIILKDNVRKNAKETLKYFKEQNVNIKIISGDNPRTVSNILKQLEIEDYDKYITGDKLPEDFIELKKIVNNYKIYGRVTPYQKQSIIKALKENATVGMIGDGVNDILALKEADCGIALASGISAARNVAEVVLTESDFAILPNIVNEGRRVVNNIERVASMYLIKTVYSFLVSILCILFKNEYPFYPVQLSLISATCVGLPSFFLALEPNYNKVKKGFLVKVFRNSLPSGICVCINILFLIIITYIFKLDFDPFRLSVVLITGYLNLRLLYKICQPLSLLRKILLYICTSSFVLLLFIFNEFFLIKPFKLTSIILALIMIYADNYIVDFLEEIYDKIVLFIEKKKRRKIINEK